MSNCKIIEAGIVNRDDIMIASSAKHFKDAEIRIVQYVYKGRTAMNELLASQHGQCLNTCIMRYTIDNYL